MVKNLAVQNHIRLD